jgi:hypothetical protein
MTALWWLIACGTEPVEPVEPPASCDDSITWDSFAAGYVQTWCTPCHSEHVAEADRQGAPVGLDFDRWSQVVAWIDRVEARSTGPDADMPPLGGTRPDDVERFAGWLRCGAPGADPEPGPCDTLQYADVPAALNSTADVDALCLAGNATRSLVVGGDLAVDCLCAIDGDLETHGTASFARLAEISGSAVVGGPALHAPSLTTLGADLTVVSERAETVDLPLLRDVGGSVRFTGPALGSIGLPQLTSVGGDLLIVEVRSATTIDLSRLRELGGDLRIVDAPSLEVVTGLRAVTRVGGDLQLERTRGPAKLDHFRVLTEVGGDVTIASVATLTELDGFTLLPSAASIRVSDVPSVSRLSGFDNLLRADALVIEDTPQLTRLDGFVNVAELGALSVRDAPALVVIEGLHALTTTGNITLERVAITHTAWLGSLHTLRGDLRAVDLASITSLDGGPDLAGVGGDVIVQRTPALTAMPLLGRSQSVDGSLVLTETGLADLDDLSELLHVGGDLVLVGNLTLSNDAALVFATGLDVDGDVTVLDNGP